jgi:hypothetical protein
MDLIEIDLIYLLKKELTINEWLTLYKISKNSQGEDIPFMTTDSCLDSLEENGWIDIIDSNIYLKNKAQKLFMNEVVNFDDIYFLYPQKTFDGRILRAKNKEVLGSLTRDYKLLSKKYHSIIKNVDTHNKVVEYLGKMIKYHEKYGKINFLPKLEVVINQRKWEQYADIEEDNGNSFSMEKL